MFLTETKMEKQPVSMPFRSIQTQKAKKNN